MATSTTGITYCDGCGIELDPEQPTAGAAGDYCSEACYRVSREEAALTAWTIAAGYVLTDDGDILLQLPDPTSRWGYVLADADRSWDGGEGVATRWTLLADDDPRISDADRERLGWRLAEARA